MEAKILIQAEPFDLNAEISAFANGVAGAVVSFNGYVRGTDEVDRLILEHYPGMTEAEIGRAGVKAAARWALTGLTVIHRIGALVPGDAIVLVAAAAPHRAEAFAACEFMMDYLKTAAPFWKAEVHGHSVHWVSPSDKDRAAIARWRQ